jgi:peroxiredoxin
MNRRHPGALSRGSSWCPYCNAELAALDDVADEIRSLGATIVAVSPQNRDGSRAFVDQLGLTFDVLYDRANAVAADYGLAFEFPAYLRDVYEGTFKLDIAAINHDTAWRLPIPARYVIGTDGVVVDARVDPDYRYRPEPAETVSVLLGMLASMR